MLRRLLRILISSLLPVTLLHTPANAQDVDTGISALEAAQIIPASEIERTGAVIVLYDIEACSGMLVSPSWVLTNAHCHAEKGDVVKYGLFYDSKAPVAVVDQSFTHSKWRGDLPHFDARLLRLKTGLFPRLESGRVWAWYRRDLFRGNVRGLIDTFADVYGYGLPSGGAARSTFGTLRLGQFSIEDVNEEVLEIDGIPAIHGGDSGAAIMVPPRGVPGAWEEYEIVAIASTSGLGHDLDYRSHGPHAAAIREWFDSTIAGDFGPLLPPYLTMSVLSAH